MMESRSPGFRVSADAGAATAARRPDEFASPEPWDLVSDGYAEEVWDRFAGYALDALGFAGVTTRSDVLDVATGPGTLALRAAPLVRRVVGVDFSARMLEELERRARRAGLTNVEVVRADAQALPLPDASFDAAFSLFGLMFFPDRGRALREMRRVLRSGGRAVISSWPPFGNSAPIQAAYEALLERMPELPLGKGGEVPLGDAEEMSAELHQAGFDAAAVHTVAHAFTTEHPAAFWTSLARSSVQLASLRRHVGEERWAALSASVVERLVQRFGHGPLEVAPQALIGVAIRP